jgi:predicted Zn-dependent protease
MKYFSWLIVVGAFTGCMTNPETGRKQLNLVGESQEMQLGISAFDQMKKEVPVSHDAAANALVQKVGKRIAAQAAGSMPNAQWEFVVFQSDEANAFCLPGGKVGVYTGILPITKDEAGLATVIGHEVAHASSHHGAERMSEATLLQTGGQVVGALSANAKPITQQGIAIAYGLGSQVGYALPHSRKQESEADHIGLRYMARAGYDPRAAVDFWQRFSQYNSQKGGSKTPGFLSTHPVDETRIKQLQEWLPEAQAEYRSSKINSPSASTRQ